MTSSEVFRRCPVCDSDKADAYMQKGSLCLVRCNLWGMIYVNPVPAAYASGAYYDQTASTYYLTPAKLESDYATVRFARELNLFRKHCARGAVLDVGCSSG